MVLRLFLALIVLAFPVFADETASIFPPNSIMQFRGLDDTSAPMAIENGRSSDLQNVSLSLAYDLSKRDGYDVVNESISNMNNLSEEFPAVTGLFYAKLSDGTAYRLATCGLGLYSDSGTAWTRIDSPSPTYANTNQNVWVVGLDTIIFSNDTNPPYKYTGSGAVAVLDVSDLDDTLTKSKCVAWFRNRVILANTVEDSTERPTRFRWSNVGTIETWTDDDYIDISALGGQEINGLIELNGDLYALLTDSIWKITYVAGSEIFVTKKVIEDIGCISKNSVQLLNMLGQQRGIVFLSDDKRVYFFSGSSIVDLTLRIREEMDDLGASRLPYAVSAVTPESYWLSVTTGSTSVNNLVLEFQYQIGEWTKHTEINANAMSYVLDNSSLPNVYFGNYDSFVYKLDTTISSDVDGYVGGVNAVGTYNMLDGTATGLTVFETDAEFGITATGATVTITSGSGVGESKVIVYHTTTGIVVDSAFSTDPTSASTFSIGAIDAYYWTKWYDFGEPSRLKQMGELYLWGNVGSSSSIDVDSAVDFGSNIGAENVSLTGTGGKWGSAIWGTSLWGGETVVFTKVKLKNQGRFVRVKFEEDDIDETFNLFGFNFLFWGQDYQ
jgi:hypothetical protein